MEQGASNSLFMCQDENENQSFGSFWNLWVTNEPILYCIIILRAWFVRHRLYPERTKSFVYVFVFVLAHEQPITTLLKKFNGDWKSNSRSVFYQKIELELISKSGFFRTRFRQPAFFTLSETLISLNFLKSGQFPLKKFPL